METWDRQRSRPIVVIGGGLAGLAAATGLAQAGRAVVLYERAAAVGGRARTQVAAGFHYNLGPHALYCGPGMAALRRLGVSWQGKKPPVHGLGVRGGVCYPLPSGPRTLMTSGLLSGAARRELLRRLPQLLFTRATALAGTSVAEWLDRDFRDPAARQLIETLIRVSSYTADFERFSAGAALAQVRMALIHSVHYIDGGWQTLVDGLRHAAEMAGVTIVADRRVQTVECDPRSGAVVAVRLADGSPEAAETVVVATAPRDASDLLGGSVALLQTWADRAIPVRAACLAVALRALPVPAAPVAFGFDRPLYLSVHSLTARLAPDGGALIHVMKYLHTDDDSSPAEQRQELEQLLDLAQPGWRDQLVSQRFQPHLTVMNALVTAAEGGLAGRPGPAVPGVPGLFVVGDWVGPSGMLSDAAILSARQATELIIARSATPARAPQPAFA